MCVYFLKLIEKLDVDVRRSRGEVYIAARDRSCFRLKASLYPKEDRKRQKKNSGMRITEGYLWQETFITAGGQ